MSDVMSTARPRVVVGVDGSPQSAQALRWAANLAERMGAVIEAVAAWQTPASFGWSVFPYDWDPAADMGKVLTGAVDEVFGPQRPDGMVLTVVEGNAAAVLVEASKSATLLIVGSRGHGGFAGLMLGSVSATVAEHAACPVLVVHGDKQPPTIAG